MPIRLSPTVKIILIACFVAFLVQQTTDQFFGGRLGEYFALVPRGFIFEGRLWQLFTYPFLHGDPLHLILNMMMLAFIASDLEYQWGRRKFLIFYFFCAVSAGILYLLLQIWIWKGQGIDQPMVGASGAIYGCLMAYGLLYGERVMLFMMLFPMKAKHFIWILAGVEFMSTVFSGRGGLSSAAHVGGMLAGVGYLWVAKARARIRSQASVRPAGRRKALTPKKKHLKLIVDNNEGSESDDDRDPPKPTWH